MPVFNPPYDQTLFHVGYKTGRYYNSHAGGISSAIAIPAVNTLYVHPAFIPAQVTIGSLQIYVSTGGATSAVKIGLWANNTDSSSAGYGRPVGAPLAAVDTGQATTATGTAGASVTSVTLKPGVYWFGVKTTGTPCTPTTISNIDATSVTNIGRSSIAGNNPPCGLATASTYATDMPTLTGGETWTDVVGGIPVVIFGT